ncbi:MAG: class I SAM-dependent methyltransferase family protein [Candidatus Paceibacteria bacterium]
MFITSNSDSSDTNQSPQRFGIEHIAQTESFEVGSWWWYIFAIPVMKIMELITVTKDMLGWLLNFEPRRTSLLFDREDAWTHDLIEYATEWRSLDDQYPYVNQPFRAFRESEKSKDILDAAWMKYMLHNQAVRNRFQIVFRLLKQNIAKRSEPKSEVRVLGLASGSGRDVIKAVAELRTELGEMPPVQAFLIDHNRNAIEKANELAGRYSLTNQIEAIRGVIRSDPAKLEQKVSHFGPDIVYNIGFFDYKPDEVVIDMKQAIQRGLNDEGVLISGNIIPNPEMKFLPRVINWAPMYHRTPEELGTIMEKAGFPGGQIYVEPNKIFAVVEALNSLPR